MSIRLSPGNWQITFVQALTSSNHQAPSRRISAGRSASPMPSVRSLSMALRFEALRCPLVHGVVLQLGDWSRRGKPSVLR